MLWQEERQKNNKNNKCDEGCGKKGKIEQIRIWKGMGRKQGY
jgi:hypothetical protein